MSAKKLKLNDIENEDIEETKNARLVLSSAVKSTNELYAAYQSSRSGSKGTTTHQEQDLLRGMLVFACSGLDAVIKQLIKDALPQIIKKDTGAQKEFEKYIDRTLRKRAAEKNEDGLVSIDTKMLAVLFAAADPREELLQMRLKDLDANSLQSRDQILMVASCFAIGKDSILIEPDMTKNAFDVRNQIIHEMDVNLEGQKKRRQRRVTVMTKYCEDVLNVATNFINSVGDKINGA